MCIYICTRAQFFQSCLTLCDPMDCTPLGSSVHGILQAIILEWVAMTSSRGSFQPRDQTHISCTSCLAGGFFTIELPEKPMYIYVCVCVCVYTHTYIHRYIYISISCIFVGIIIWGLALGANMICSIPYVFSVYKWKCLGNSKDQLNSNNHLYVFLTIILKFLVKIESPEIIQNIYLVDRMA